MTDIGRRWRGLWRAAFFVVGLWMCAAASADDRVLLLDPAVGRVSLDHQGQVWTDPTGRLGIDDVVAARDLDWAPTAAGQVHPLHPGVALWMRFMVGESDDSQRDSDQ